MEHPPLQQTIITNSAGESAWAYHGLSLQVRLLVPQVSIDSHFRLGPRVGTAIAGAPVDPRGAHVRTQDASFSLRLHRTVEDVARTWT